MKKLVAVLGSTRADSSSSRIAGEVLRGAREKGYEIVTYYPGVMNVKGCLGCGSCKRMDTDCVIQDDMQAYFKDLHSCDVLLLAVPNYFGQAAGHMVTFMNRHFCLTGPDKRLRLEPGKRVVGIFSQGAPDTMTIYQKNYDWYLDCFRQMGLDINTKITIGRNSDFSMNSQIMQKAYEVGSHL